jgi:hypothetical protein
MIILLPIVICVVGLLLFMLSTQPKVAEVGKIMFWTGLLVTLFSGGPLIAGVVK